MATIAAAVLGQLAAGIGVAGAAGGTAAAVGAPFVLNQYGAMLAGSAVGTGTLVAPAAAVGAAGLLSGGSRVASILSGGASALSILMGLGAADEQATALEADAADATGEIATEAIQNLQRRASLKKALQEAIGDIDTATAASGVDLSFGTPAEARQEAYREADRAVSLDNETTTIRTNRLFERARLYRLQARSTRRGSVFEAIAQGGQAAAGIAYRG